MKEWADELLNRKDVLILDTETTGLDDTADLVELAIIDTKGRVLFNELIQPTTSIPWQASKIHGISDSTLRKVRAKPWSSHWAAVKKILRKADMLLVYNLKFDERIIQQTCGKYNLPDPLGSIQRECVMLKYAEFRAIPGQFGDPRWHKLVDAYSRECGEIPQEHRALSDCQMVLEVMKAVAAGESSESTTEDFGVLIGGKVMALEFLMEMVWTDRFSKEANPQKEALDFKNQVLSLMRFDEGDPVQAQIASEMKHRVDCIIERVDSLKGTRNVN